MEARPQQGARTVSLRGVHSVTRMPHPVPLALEAVHAGFPSVAQDYFSTEFSFDEHVFIHPDSTFVVRVAGDSMTGAGIFDGDLLVVDRGLDPCDGDVVIAILDDELTVKRLRSEGGRTWLQAENPAYPDFKPQGGEVLVVWGVVTGNYHWQREETPARANRNPAPSVSCPRPGAPTAGAPSSARAGHGRQSGGPSSGQGTRRSAPYPSAGWGGHA
ncbi:LexA family protein [Bifidobacterium actinocoloniiforme]|nr:S24 family peptidase [Bifidobacterium actinocoloniiforme]